MQPQSSKLIFSRCSTPKPLESLAAFGLSDEAVLVLLVKPCKRIRTCLKDMQDRFENHNTSCITISDYQPPGFLSRHHISRPYALPHSDYADSWRHNEDKCGIQKKCWVLYNSQYEMPPMILSSSDMSLAGIFAGCLQANVRVQAELSFESNRPSCLGAPKLFQGFLLLWYPISGGCEEAAAVTEDRRLYRSCP